MTVAEAVLRTQIRLETDVRVEMRGVMLHRTDTVGTRIDSAATSMSMAYVFLVYDCVKPDILRTKDGNVLLQETVVDSLVLFIEILQVYNNNKFSNLKANATVVDTVHPVMLKGLEHLRRFLIDHGNYMVALPLVMISETNTDAEDTSAALKQSKISLSALLILFDAMTATCSTGSTDMKLKLFYEDIHRFLASMNESARRGYDVSISKKPRPPHPKITAACCNTPGGTYMSRMKHDLTLYLCIRCPVFIDNIFPLASGTTRHDTNVCNAYKELQAVLDKPAVPQRIGKKTAASENRQQF